MLLKPFFYQTNTAQTSRCPPRGSALITHDMGRRERWDRTDTHIASPSTTPEVTRLSQEASSVLSSNYVHHSWTSNYFLSFKYFWFLSFPSDLLYGKHPGCITETMDIDDASCFSQNICLLQTASTLIVDNAAYDINLKRTVQRNAAWEPVKSGLYKWFS